MQPWDLAGSFQGAELNRQKISQGDVDAAGQAAAGRALMFMIPGAQPMAPAGQPNAMGMPQQNPLQRLQALFQAPQQSPGAGAPPGGMPQAPIPGAQPMPVQAPQMGVPGGGMSPAMSGQPPMGGAPQPPMGGAPQPGGMGGGMPALTWQGVVQQVVKANPGVRDPRVITAAVDRFMPIMNQQSQMEWRAIALGIRQQQADTQRIGAETRATQGEQRIEQGQQRLDTQEQQGAERIKQGAERLDVQKQREGRLAGSAKVREDQQFQRLELQRKALETRITQGNQRQLLGQWRAILDAQHKRAQEIIQSGSSGGMPMDANERKKLLDEENTRYEDAIRQMRSGGATGATFDEKFNAGGQQQGGVPQRPQNVPEGSAYSPSRRMWKDPQGKLYGPDGTPARE